MGQKDNESNLLCVAALARQVCSCDHLYATKQLLLQQSADVHGGVRLTHVATNAYMTDLPLNCTSKECDEFVMMTGWLRSEGNIKSAQTG